MNWCWILCLIIVCSLFFLCVHVHIFLHHNDFSLIVQCPQIFTKHVCDKFGIFRKPFHLFPEASQGVKFGTWIIDGYSVHYGVYSLIAIMPNLCRKKQRTYASRGVEMCLSTYVALKYSPRSSLTHTHPI